MAKIYARWIADGRLTLAEVPERWRAATAELVKSADAWREVPDSEIQTESDEILNA